MAGEYFFYIVWLAMHAVAALIAQTRDVYLLVYNRLVRAVCARRGGEDVFAGHTRLKKLPEHLSVLLPSSPQLTNDHLNVLVNLVLWCLATNVSYVSFYDPIGLLVKKEDELMKNVQSRMDKDHRLIWHGASSTGRNGFAGPKVHVKVLDVGRSLLVDSCKELAGAEENITVPVVGKHQLNTFEFPDPQVVVYFGRYLNPYGYPPWQMRLSEFISGGADMSDFSESRFFGVLQCYSRCQQREGK